MLQVHSVVLMLQIDQAEMDLLLPSSNHAHALQKIAIELISLAGGQES